ncbi:MAG: hypothetical protein ACLP9S_00340 [Syntrophales bacterium]
MNLFRSEEHVRNWKSFIAGTDEGILSLDDLRKLFSGPFFRRRMEKDYLSHIHEYAREMVQGMKEIGKTGPFWKKSK